MDINAVGIGAIIGATLTAVVNITLFQLNRIKDEKKERLKNLYYPLQSVIDKKYKTIELMKGHFSQDFESFAIAYYKFFLEMRDIYLDNRVYESKELREAFHLSDSYHRKEELNFTKWTSNEDERLKNLALFELKHVVDEDGLSEIERNLQNVIEVIRTDIKKLT